MKYSWSPTSVVVFRPDLSTGGATTAKIGDVQIAVKNFPDLCLRDIVEIYHPEDEYSRLLLQITSFPGEEFNQKDVISIEQSIASTFKLRPYKEVIVRKVDPKNVALDLVELLFKDQYFSRSDFWRLRIAVTNTGVYLHKKIEHAEMRAQVNEMWSRGERVTCGVITDDTRIVFRSSTSVVQIFIQMSAEMWDFDFIGDKYFEKAVNGFLTDLFAKWKEQNCLHDVTIVLFSRTFYKAQSLDDFPVYMRDCIECDYKGRFYEDFYRIVIQNERYDDWTSTINTLRKLCDEYTERIINYHQRPGVKVPTAYNSTAAEGNFLETLNMSLNLFENYNQDRNFDRTAKVAVVITPGQGVFEVDRELTNITKQRTIDCGIGSDLVCMGEQPLHAAPLFRFHSRDTWNSTEVGDDYNIPHWMNHSFYTSKNQLRARLQGCFIPRIKPPPQMFVKKKKPKEKEFVPRPPSDSEDDNFPFTDYDEYDAQVWKLPMPNYPRFGKSDGFYHTSTRRQPRTFAEAKQLHRPRTRHTSDEVAAFTVEKKKERKSVAISSSAITIPSVAKSMSGEDLVSSVGCFPLRAEQPKSKESGDVSDNEDQMIFLRKAGSAGSPVGHSRKSLQHKKPKRRALINPFAPSRMKFKMTSNRRRWVHAFPTDPRGAAVQTHHFHTNSTSQDTPQGEQLSREVIQVSNMAAEARRQRTLQRQDSDDRSDENNSDRQLPVGSVDSLRSISPIHHHGNSERHLQVSSAGSGSTAYLFDFGKIMSQQSRNDGSKSYLWGPTGEQEWSPDMTTGTDWRPLESEESLRAESCLIKPILHADIHSQNFCAGISVDWKSLTIPASLPITTDYLPEKKSLEKDYSVSLYTLIPDDVNSDYLCNPPSIEDEKFYKKVPLTVQQVFKELISQRLSQGFQIITTKKAQTPTTDHTLSSSPQYQHTSKLKRARPRSEQQEECHLSIGRIFHKLALCGPSIQVTIYKPRHEHRQMKFYYRYRFQNPDSFTYDVSASEFKSVHLEHYNWNCSDQYICTRGDGDYGLMELLQSLKFWRSRFFLLPCNNPATKKIIDGHDRCDIYEEKTSQELQQLVSGFVKYLELLNKIKRTGPSRRQKHSGDQVPSTSADPTATGKPSDSDKSSQKEVESLNSGLPLQKLIEAMKDPQTGIPLLSKQPGLPENCFVSADAVDWCIKTLQDVKTIKQAVLVMQVFLDESLICHSSCNPAHKFIYGTYLYHIVPPKEKSKDIPPTYINPVFQNEWCEVAILPVETQKEEVTFNLDPGRKMSLTSIDPDLDNWKELADIDEDDHSATIQHKFVNIEVDVSNKSDRPEWAMAQYHAYYSPLCAMELQAQWMVATGCILGDTIYTWARKATACGFHLLPVPCDPFALPSAPESDPLRGPIFVPLEVGSLFDEGQYLFKEPETRTQKMTLFQDSILKRYGFMPTSVCVSREGRFPVHGSSSPEDQQQYVHCTGGMFVLIENTQITSPTAKRMPHFNTFGKKSSSEMRKDYIARQTSSSGHVPMHVDSKIGFLWSWNFMSSKRWRSQNTGDEHFQDKMLADFRNFCSNQGGRLKDFWNDYKLENII
ncbi:hypothetical protein FSP39_006992 [Pinctada imbricata]|uniref:DEP domain-containing protein n=1 Tax=Pinctada imbricata TaxID=66713 RepID=A0AA89BU84_PINIB|nr:hypothetical protein FSP39_006992 [Pinctada imbricata]